MDPASNEHYRMIGHGCKDDTLLILSCRTSNTFVTPTQIFFIFTTEIFLGSIPRRHGSRMQINLSIIRFYDNGQHYMITLVNGKWHYLLDLLLNVLIFRLPILYAYMDPIMYLYKGGLSYINVNVKFIEVESGHFCVKVTKKLMILVCHN